MRKTQKEKPISKPVRSVVRKSPGNSNQFHIEFKNPSQKMAYAGFQQHDILFLSGSAGVGKSFLAMAFAVNEILLGNKKKIILTRPIVEAGEKLGFLPGSYQEKVDPYMMPLWDCIYKLVGDHNPQRDKIDRAIEVAPVAYMRGRTLDDAVCIFDEAQNASLVQLKLFLTRLGENSKMILTGDPSQSDLVGSYVALADVMERLENVPGIAMIHFDSSHIVRHPLVEAMVNRFAETE